MSCNATWTTGGRTHQCTLSVKHAGPHERRDKSGRMLHGWWDDAGNTTPHSAEVRHPAHRQEGRRGMTPVEKAALAWWQAKRPFEWDEPEHIASPTVNQTSPAEKLLACEVARMLAASPSADDSPKG